MAVLRLIIHVCPLMSLHTTRHCDNANDCQHADAYRDRNRQDCSATHAPLEQVFVHFVRVIEDRHCDEFAEDLRSECALRVSNVPRDCAATSG